RLAELHRKIAFFGTPEKDYLDSGLWHFLPYVRTKDEHDALNPVKPLPVDPDTGKTLAYILAIFHMLLRHDELMIPKSRQIMVSWILAIYSCWLARTQKHGLILLQSKKEEDAAKMVSMGKDDLDTARMTFIETHLENPDGTPATWLMDPKVRAAKGVAYNKIGFKNGTNVEGVPQGGDQIRSRVPSFYANDESAFQDEFGKAYEAAQPALQGGGRAVYVSSAAPGYFCDLVNDYPGYTDGAEPPYKNMKLPKGMSFWYARGTIPVLRVHYSADPMKDPDRYGKEWLLKASARYGGIHSPGWQQEMEINWKVSGGSPVWAQASRVDWPVIIKPRDVDVVKNRHYLMAGFDYGSANDPSVFEVIAVDEHGKLFFDWEWYAHGATYKEAARAIKACPYFDLVKNRMVADPSLWAMTQNQDGCIKSIAQLFAEEGVHFIRGKKGSPSADVRVEEMFRAKYWANPEKPEAFISLDCQKLIESVRMLRWAEHRSEATKAREHSPLAIVHKWNDPWDAIAYPIDLLMREFKVPAIPLPHNSYKATRDRAERAAKKSKMAKHFVGGL
ncbi:MAG: hypothetical protein IPN19_12235, partial [Elusimicrobia bacterium]|nr:hypothetical protein [Elusimicrobiota bacterium]